MINQRNLLLALDNIFPKYMKLLLVTVSIETFFDVFLKPRIIQGKFQVEIELIPFRTH